MAETLFNILKISVICAIAYTFMIAITSLITLVSTLVFPSVIGEVFGIMSACLPFNAIAVFGAIGNATVAILSFLIAKKIFDLTSWGVSTV